MNQIRQVATAATCTTEGSVWRLHTERAIPARHRQWSAEETAFWPTCCWNDNPAIVDETGRMLTGRKYDRIKECPLAELHIQRCRDGTYTLTIPHQGGNHHQSAKLKRWAIAISSSSPRLAEGETMQVGTTATLRHPTQLQHQYQWGIVSGQRILGSFRTPPGSSTEYFELQQQPDGIHWWVGSTVKATAPMQQDIEKLQKREQEGNIVFNAHPTLHGYPWSVPDAVANKHVFLAIKKHVFREYRGTGGSIKNIVAGLQKAALESSWHAAALQKTPKQIWAHDNELTAYQVWVC
jgi:hypothetical protein